MNTPQKQETCEERIERHMESRLDDLRLLFCPEKDDFYLADDGTMDTIIEIGDEQYRFDAEYASSYRDEETGELDLESFMDDNFDDMREHQWERFCEYGLSFDYVAPDTFKDQEQGYFRYQISWGGPSEEFRFYVGAELNPYKIEFWFLDWFDGASRRLYGNDFDLLYDIFQFFKDCGTVEQLLEESE